MSATVRKTTRALLAAIAGSLVLVAPAAATHQPGFNHSNAGNTELHCTSPFIAICLWIEYQGPATAVHVETTSTDDNAKGVIGEITSTAPGAASTGVQGINRGTGTNGNGVWGYHWGQGIGVLGESGSSGTGVRGRGGNGGWFSSTVGNGTGVLGTVTANGHGVRGEAGLNGIGVIGTNAATSGASYGVKGNSAAASDLAAGVFGQTTANHQLAAGVYGNAASGIGALGIGGAYGVLGYSTSGLAGLFVGNAHVTGTLSAGTKAFRIDHPLEPKTKYLQHSTVESPDMKNVYDGVVRTDRRGYATVLLPRYFGALNRDFRYQLTIVGRRGWRARVVREIADNHFRLQSDEARVQVSWQVTGIRKDRYANAHRILPEIAKSAADRAASEQDLARAVRP